jgi:hypothetical protein
MNWSAAATGTTNTLWRIACGNGVFVAVGDAGAMASSTNGVDWTAFNSRLTTNTINDICWGNGMFAAATDGGEILTSPDGSQWALQQPGAVSSLSGIAFGGGAFVAVGSSGSAPMALSSTDGSTWTSSTPGQVTPTCVTYANGSFLAVGNGAMVASPDGLNWSTVNASSVGDLNLERVCYAHQTFVGVGKSGEIATSTNGLDWVVETSWTDFNLFDVAYGSDTFVVVGDNGTILQSDPLPPLGLSLSAGGWLTDRAFSALAAGPAGQTWEIQASTNLVDWTWLAQFPSTNATMPFVDLGATNYGRRFYRGQWW